MKNWLLYVLSAIVLTSCSSSTKSIDSIERTPQQAQSDEEIFENSFQTVMNATGTNQKEIDQNRARQMAAYLHRQMGYFYLASGLVMKFDEELNRLYRVRVRDASTEIDTTELEKLNFQLNVAREMVERNLHELQHVFARLLEEGNGKGPLQKAAWYSLTALNKPFDVAWTEGDQWAVISLAQEFKATFEQVQAANPSIKMESPKFFKYTKKSEEEKRTAYARNILRYESRKPRYVDSFLQKKWDDYQAERKAEQEKEKSRQPNAAQIYPDAGSAGTINGSAFPKGTWALTFDDGPHPKHTKGMLDALNRGNYRGMFFWLSKNMKAMPAIVDQTKNEGSRRASHSYTHANLPKLNSAGLDKEITQAATAFEEVVGSRPTFFRCPYGACGPSGGAIRQKIAQNKMVHALWNVDTLDWQDKNPESIFQRTKKQMEVQGRGIVLFHDIHPQSVKATELLVDWLQTKSTWKVMTLDEIVSQETGKDYPSP